MKLTTQRDKVEALNWPLKLFKIGFIVDIVLTLLKSSSILSWEYSKIILVSFGLPLSILALYLLVFAVGMLIVIYEEVTGKYNG